MPARQTDPFGTAELRRRVLDGWAAAPARFREDANAEEDHALGGYKDRAVVELAQNAADAAARAGGAGRLLLRLDGDVLTAANSGAPLTADGVESMSTLRASAKRDGEGEGAVGRFGVGFSAVAALSDDVTAASTDGVVRWSRALALEEVRAGLTGPGRADPGLEEEVERRGGDLPLLRLPFAAVPEGPAAAVPEGYTTAVTLRLRDDDTRRRVAELLDGTGEALLLALPALAEVRVEADGRPVRVLRRAAAEPYEAPDTVDAEGAAGSADVVTTVEEGGAERTTRWRTVTRTGVFEPSLLADRPTEERSRLGWTLTWATAVADDGSAGLPDGVPRVVHAPTPSDAELALPALLIGSFPLTPDRRRIAEGPAAEALVAEAAEAYAALLCGLEPRAALDLVPLPSLGHGPFDGHFRAAAAKPLQEAPFLRTVYGRPVRPLDAVLVEPGPPVAEVLAEALPTALGPDADAGHPALAQLRVRRLGPAELVDLLADRDAEPSWWAGLYRALRTSAGRGTDLDELGALPVPLADGRLVRGPRGLLLPSGGAFGSGALDPAALAPLGVRIVHAAAADSLLSRLGAVEAGEQAVLDDPAVRAAVGESLDADDPEAVSGPVLELVAAAGVGTGPDADRPWLAELALRDDEGAYSVAGELLLPDSPLRGILADDAPFGVVAPELVERHGRAVLAAVGCLDGFAVLRAEDVTLGEALEESLDELPVDGLEEWAEDAVRRAGEEDLPPTVPELTAVADLEFVRPDRWERALDLLAGSPARRAVTEPARLLLEGGRAADVPSYTAWWLRTGASIGGHRPGDLRLPGADPVLEGLYEPAPEGLDPELARAVGVRSSLEELVADPDGPDDLLERLADPERHVEHTALRRIWSALARVPADRVVPPERVRAVAGGAIVVADAEDAAVVDAPDLLPLAEGRPLLPAPAASAEALADVLDLSLLSEAVEGRVESSGRVRPVPDEVRLFAPEGALTYVHHDTLLVDGTEVEWRVAEGTLHASTPEGLARALCWSVGTWARRHLVAAVLRAPDRAPFLLAEADLE
ncbi:sacsin N-terminal ATP-binding-like domain-containing protein [Nocardiopsis suaedae]|uniref:ATP-binding protein n=1 Tax=Nocardiopsis suaedae TaxID=3018444 RepID=A0ABT4TME7_9ACTN|nr:ATP-binding protein [Nocardiopsis suaedae]MDA2805868.1 ATP-binding protein [Nocardiopsis suaedae]